MMPLAYIGFNILSLFTVFWRLNLTLTPAAYPIALVVGLLNDIDDPDSLVGKAFPGLSRLVAYRFGRQTFTHSLVFLGLVGLVTLPLILRGYLTWWVAIIFALGGHIFMDTWTKDGVELFYPISHARIIFLPRARRERIEKGSIAEKNFCYIWFIGGLVGVALHCASIFTGISHTIVSLLLVILLLLSGVWV